MLKMKVEGVVFWFLQGKILMTDSAAIVGWDCQKMMLYTKERQEEAYEKLL